MKVKVGRKSQTFSKIKTARTTIAGVKADLADVREKMAELDKALKSCGSALAKIERKLNTITRENLVATPKITKKRRPTLTRKETTAP